MLCTKKVSYHQCDKQRLKLSYMSSVPEDLPDPGHEDILPHQQVLLLPLSSAVLHSTLVLLLIQMLAILYDVGTSHETQRAVMNTSPKTYVKNSIQDLSPTKVRSLKNSRVRMSTECNLLFFI